ncbi:organelle RRM domain-containing protein 1, chloroplastic isoform X2 [Momordica charantia]|uniref:Organelle RRM domain-containing protein 1, chloroplastic isoform X2 n=1 Tax=Momordica charantia TaxID=3673 RepID=A0A6J1C236_MOMCH|nr:organelle RRM domain-containing protein 1, chloroplastic isoform X2 [Momordica charantia]
MEVLSPSATVSTSHHFSFPPHKPHFKSSAINIKFLPSPSKNNKFSLPSTSHLYSTASPRRYATVNLASTSSTSTSTVWSPAAGENRHWMVLMEAPPRGVTSKPEVVDYYVKALERVLGSERDAQMCIYDASWDSAQFGFCCYIDEQTSIELARVPGVISIKPDPNVSSIEDYGSSTPRPNPQNGGRLLFPSGSTKHWLVRIDKPGIGVVTKAQMVDYYVEILTKVLGNDKDAQMCIYHVSWQSSLGFCCELDEECARELAGIPGVLSVQQDENFEAENKKYGGGNAKNPLDLPDSSEDQRTPVKTKKLFITGLSFYTSEKTLRAAFEGFGELVEDCFYGQLK